MNVLIAAIQNEMARLNKQATALLGYMQAKLEQRDFHAVSDAANDMRELDAQFRVYQTVLARLQELAGLGEEQPKLGADGSGGAVVPALEKQPEQAIGGASGSDHSEEDGIAQGART